MSGGIRIWTKTVWFIFYIAWSLIISLYKQLKVCHVKRIVEYSKNNLCQLISAFELDRTQKEEKWWFILVSLFFTEKLGSVC